MEPLWHIGKKLVRKMTVDNRIPSYPYMELNGIAVYVEGVRPNELGVTDGFTGGSYGIGRVNELDELIYGTNGEK